MSSSRKDVSRNNPIMASIESSRPSPTYSSSKSGESGSGRFSTTCRRHQAELGKGASQRTSSSGGGGRWSRTCLEHPEATVGVGPFDVLWIAEVALYSKPHLAQSL